MPEIEVKVKMPTSPELLGEMFARMNSEEQAAALSECWRQMVQQYGGAYKSAMQCAYIREDLGGDARELLEHLTAPDEPEGFVLDVHREPSLSELLNAKRYIDRKLREHGADGPKTYTVEKLHDDGSKSTVSGLTADEVLDCYLNDRAHPADVMEYCAAMTGVDTDVLPDKPRRFMEAYGMGAEKVARQLQQVPPPDKVLEDFKAAHTWPNKCLHDFSPAALVEEATGGCATRTTVKWPLREQPLGQLGLERVNVDVQPHTVVTFQPAKPLRQFEEVLMDGFPVGEVVQVNDDGTVDVQMYRTDGIVRPMDPVFADQNPCGEIALPDFRGQWNSATRTSTCPDCKGSGKYVGITSVEPCACCNGTGAL